MVLKNKLVAKSSKYSEPLNCIIPDNFQIQKTVNQSWQLQFDAYDDKSVAFNLLQAQNSILWEGQEFVIKQTQPTYENSLNTTQVTATHIGYDVSRIFQYNSNEGTKTYSVADVLKFYLDGNSFGYTYEVKGNFPNEEIENLGNGSGQDMLSKITSAWDNAVIDFDNKKIIVYNIDDYYVDKGKVITYMGNSTQVQLTYDSTNLCNKLYCIGETDSDGKTAFDPFYVTDQDSIDKYGVYEGTTISDNRFTDAASMKSYAESQLQPEPALSIQVDFVPNEDDYYVGDICALIIPELDLTTQVKVTQVTLYPLSSNQQSQVQLENTAQTILNYNNSLLNMLNGRNTGTNITNSALNNAIQNNQNEINKINESLQQQTEVVSTTNGTLTFTLNNGVVYVDCQFTGVKTGSSWNVPNGYAPKATTSNTLIINVDKNYIINYTLSPTAINITGITDLQGNTIDNLSDCSGSFNYLI